MHRPRRDLAGEVPGAGEGRGRPARPAAPGATVLVVGVVNSLLDELRSRGLSYVPCDLKGGTTEWGEPVVTDALAAEIGRCDAVLASGMTLGNGTFEPLRRHALDARQASW